MIRKRGFGALFVVWLVTIRLSAADKIDVLLLSGMNNHDWRATTPALKESLERTGNFEVTVLERTETMTARLLERYDVVVSNFNTFVSRSAPEKDPGWSPATKKALIGFVKGGKGHVTVHAGSSSFYDWPEYHRMALGSFKVGQTSHGRQHEFPVSLKPHSITEGVADFRAFDELWHGTRFEENATVLATAFSSRASGGSGKEEPVAVAGRFGAGRSFFLVLGHNVRGIESAGFQALFTRGTEWAATGAVTVSASPPTADSVAEARRFRWRRTETSLELTRGSEIGGTETVWRFNHDPRPGKTYFDPLGPVGGPSLTWVMPPDHPWHYGLWFSWKYLNGSNYWEENATTHRGEGHTTATRITCTPRDDDSALISMELSYHTAGKSPTDAILEETRTIEISAPRRDGSYDLDWTATYTAGSSDVELNRTPLPHEHGGKSYGGYAGLSLRLRNLDGREAHSTLGPVQFSAQDRYRGEATAFDYSGVLDGQVVGVAIVDHPENLNAPTPWYAIRSRVMTFFTPAVICFKPYTLKAGKSFTLRYRVVVHRGRWNAERLKELYGRFTRKPLERSED